MRFLCKSKTCQSGNLYYFCAQILRTMARIIFLLVIFALVVVIVVYLVKAIKMNNPKEEKQTPIQKTKERTNYSVADELLKLQNLKEEGIITEKEFEEMKKKLME